MDSFIPLVMCSFARKSCETVSADCTCMHAFSLVLDDDGTVLCSPAVRAIVEIVRSVAL